MNKQEFVRELENSLRGRLSDAELEQILMDYRDIFDGAREEGKSEEQVAREIGSPSAIARTILEESTGRGTTAPKPDVSDLASMGRRAGALVLDSLVVGLVAALIIMSTLFTFTISGTRQISPFGDGGLREVTVYNWKGELKRMEVFDGNQRIFRGDYEEYQSFLLNNGLKGRDITIFETRGNQSGFQGIPFPRAIAILPLMAMVLATGMVNLFTALQLWLFKGYTLGKWIMKIRVVRLDGRRLGFWDAFLRDGIIKCFANTVTSGILNLLSFIWACATPEHKTIQDLAAGTKVVIAR